MTTALCPIDSDGPRTQVSAHRTVARRCLRCQSIGLWSVRYTTLRPVWSGVHFESQGAAVGKRHPRDGTRRWRRQMLRADRYWLPTAAAFATCLAAAAWAPAHAASAVCAPQRLVVRVRAHHGSTTASRKRIRCSASYAPRGDGPGLVPALRQRVEPHRAARQPRFERRAASPAPGRSAATMPRATYRVSRPAAACGCPSAAAFPVPCW